MITVENFEELKLELMPNANICIFGAGNAGIATKKYLNSKGIKITHVIDTYKTGTIETTPIIHPDKLTEINYDILINTIARDRYIIETLATFANTKKYIKLSNAFISEFKHLNQNINANFINEKVANVLKILETQEDKELYEIVLKARFTKNFTKIHEYIKQKHNIEKNAPYPFTTKQYLTHINPEKIEYVIEGGFANGLNSIIFKSKFKNLKKLFAFEVIYDKMKHPLLDSILQKIQEIKMINKVLWDGKETLEFDINHDGLGGSSITKANQRKNATKKQVESISIDEFMEENKIEKLDFIKLEIEGAELNTLKGGINSIKKHRPQIAVAIYHKNEHLTDIPLYLKEQLDDYIFKIEHYSPCDWETVLYALPKEKI